VLGSTRRQIGGNDFIIVFIIKPISYNSDFSITQILCVSNCTSCLLFFNSLRSRVVCCGLLLRDRGLLLDTCFCLQGTSSVTLQVVTGLRKTGGRKIQVSVTTRSWIPSSARVPSTLDKVIPRPSHPPVPGNVLVARCERGEGGCPRGLRSFVESRESQAAEEAGG
jgi:hypothetical protein